MPLHVFDRGVDQMVCTSSGTTIIANGHEKNRRKTNICRGYIDGKDTTVEEQNQVRCEQTDCWNKNHKIGWLQPTIQREYNCT